MALAKLCYQDLVFINCPFDPGYLPILRAIIFTIYRCGFSPISALSYDNGTQNRLEKINQCIASAQFGIHDISNIRLSKNKFPRFNMPFELGLFFGAKEFGGKLHQTKNAIIFDSSRYRYLQRAPNVIKHIRNWLRTASKRNDLPGAIIMQNEYKKIARTIPALAKEMGEKPEDIPYNDYCAIMESAVKKNTNGKMIARLLPRQFTITADKRFRMIKTLFFPFMIFITISAFGQNKIESFKADFSKALNNNFSEKQLNIMFREYSELLTPHSDVTRLYEMLQGHEVSVFPLYNFKNEKLYSDNIIKLLNSKNPNQRILAYLSIASSDDTSKEDILLERIKIEKNKGTLIWAGMALLYLKCNHTTELFDFLVKNEDFGDAHMLPMYVQLDKDSLQQTAYNRIDNNDVKSKILAAQILSVTPLNSKTEALLKLAAESWDMNIKGYALYSVKELQMSNLLQTLKPLLSDKRTRSISLEALANSPTETDRNYLFELVNNQDTVSAELLNCFYKSKNIENIKYWLKLLYTKNIPKDYLFFVYDQPLIYSDSILPDLQIALENIKGKHLLGELVRSLDGRTDDKSVEIIITLLRHSSPSVRYWTAKTVENNPSERFKSPDVRKLITQGLEDGNTTDD